MASPRLAVRGLLLIDNKLLLVNAWPGGRGDLWCAPGGGVNRGASLHDNLIREMYEETGLNVSVGDPCLLNEFHDPKGTFHQVDIYFRCTVVAGTLDPAWADPEGIVINRRLVTRAELSTINAKPDSLGDAAWGTSLLYDPLEPILR